MSCNIAVNKQDTISFSLQGIFMPDKWNKKIGLLLWVTAENFSQEGQKKSEMVVLRGKVKLAALP